MATPVPTSEPKNKGVNNKDDRIFVCFVFLFVVIVIIIALLFGSKDLTSTKRGSLDIENGSDTILVDTLTKETELTYNDKKEGNFSFMTN